jgi:hypothetical protein
MKMEHVEDITRYKDNTEEITNYHLYVWTRKWITIQRWLQI